MPTESQIPIASQAARRRFATRLALFYGTSFGLIGSHLPFFPVWLKAVGIDASWIGIITAVPAVTRFTILPVITTLAERRRSLRGAMIITSFATALGFALVGTQHLAPLVFLAYALTACVWTPMVPLTDAYALRGVARYGLNYGPLRLWGSAAFVVGALACGLLVEVIAPRHLIWAITTGAALSTIAGLGLKPLDHPKPIGVAAHGDGALLRNRGFLAVIVAAALIQGSHAAYYTFASITWQGAGLDGLTIAGLWVLGVLAEIVVFALSPRFTLQPSTLVVIGGLAAVARWLITAQEPSVAVLSVVQLAARADLRAHASRHHGAIGPACPGPHHGARAGLLRRLQRHCRVKHIDPVRRGLCALRAGRLLRDGGDGVFGRARDVVGAAYPNRSSPQCRFGRID